VTLAFHPELDGKQWDKVGRYLCSPVERDNDLDKLGNRTRQQALRLRPQLGQYKDVISEGAAGLLGRGETVRIDWYDFQTYGDKENERALSLIAGGPLVKVRSGNELKVETLRKDVHDKIKEAANKRLQKLGDCVVPANANGLSLTDPVFEQLHKHRPQEWTPQEKTVEPSPQPVRSTPPTRREPPSPYADYPSNELFEPCPEGDQFLARELAEADDGVWWSGEGEWMGAFFAFWHKLHTTPCDDVAITYTDESYGAERFGESLEENKPKLKATIVDARELLSDADPKKIQCGVTNWGFAYKWASMHGDKLLTQSPPASVFGLEGRPAYPGIASVHVIFQTSDGYLLFGLRAPKIAFHERTWSASFEEQIAVEPREFTGEPEEGDRNLLDVIHGGLYEEWFIPENAVAETSCLAIGREWGRSTYEGKPFINRSATIIAACRLNIPLATVWARLDEKALVRDREEHRAWAGIRFGSRADVLRFVVAARGRHDATNLLAELCDRKDIDAELAFYPGGVTASIRDLGLMPTSAARLVLGSSWLSSLSAD
jgi:hypothetical protein